MKTEGGRIKREIKDAKDGSASASTSASTYSPLTSYVPRLIVLGLILLTLAVFWRVGGNGFVDFDDNIDLTENHHVQKGLTIQGVLWALRSTYASNWQPITWLSHMLDVTLYGMNPAGHHWTSLLFHGMNVLLLFGLFRRMTRALWPSAFVAALFAIHPLHVESVAWLAERKDLLSTFFGLLALWAYVGYAEGRKALDVRRETSDSLTSAPSLTLTCFSRYLAVLGLFTLGLMAKPMLVTFPFLLLLLDYWPLGRLKLGLRRSENSTVAFLLFEKLPFFFLAIASCVITFWAQQKGRSVLTLEQIPIGLRFENALVSYVGYLAKTLWPHNLAVFYPHPLDTLDIWRVLGAGSVLIAISVWVTLCARRHPYLLVGWLWYLGTLVPVIGIVQVGTQAMADRYTYLPLIGIFTMLAWGVTEIKVSGFWFRVSGVDPKLETRNLAWAGGPGTWGARRGQRPRHLERQRRGSGGAEPKLETPRLAAVLGGAAVLVIVLLSIAAWVQVGYWKDSTILFEHAIEAVPGNYFAYNGLGLLHEEQGKPEEAIAYYRRAIALNPGDPKIHSNLGNTFAEEGKADEAIKQYREAIAIDSHFAKAHNYLGIVLAQQGKFDEAIDRYAEAIRINPDYFEAQNNLGLALAKEGKIGEAIDHFAEAIRINPDKVDGHYNLAGILTLQGRFKEAIGEYRQAIFIDPENEITHYNLGLALGREGQFDEAAAHYLEAVRIKPDHLEAHLNLGFVLARQGKFDEAIAHYNQGITIQPNHEKAHFHLGTLLAGQGRLEEAAAHLSEAVRIKPDDFQAHYNLGIVDEKLNRSKEAMAEFQTALRINPNLPAAREKVSEVRR